jgi:hypothetical protein
MPRTGGDPQKRPRTAVENPRIRFALWVDRSPHGPAPHEAWRAGVVGASEMATGVVAVIPARASIKVRIGKSGHAPTNFTTIKHMALNLIRRARGKDSLRLLRKVAAWDDDFLASLTAA